MAQNITLLGAQYNDVPAVQLPKTGGGTARFDDASITTAVASDVAQGKLFLAADGTITTGTNSGGGGGADMPTFTIVWDDNFESVVSATCDWTFAECNNYSGVALVNDNTQSGTNEEIGSATIIGGYGSYIDYTVYLSGVYPSYDIRYNSNGTISVTFPSQTYETLNVTANGSYYPQGGIITEVNVNVSSSSKNIQIDNEYKQRTANSYGATGLTLTVAKTGTYTVTWTAWRGSSSGTMGTNLHVNNTTGTNQQTWTGTYGQLITLTNQSYTQGDILTLYATSGSNSRSVYVANLMIIEQ